MDTDTLVIVGAVGLTLAAFAYKQYLRLKPQIDAALEDGTLSVSEVMDLVDEAKEVIEEVKELKETIPDLASLKKLKKADLMALCEKHDLDTDGTKAVLIEALKSKV
mgnify:CR=1 FL=1|tara:strand:- start:3816 stop:4136 length:321 start_codon:yes stop_codon:yes gene_type:complete